TCGLDLATDLVGVLVGRHRVSSFPLSASGIFFAVLAVLGMPLTSLSLLRPVAASTSATRAQRAATMSAAQLCPMAPPIAHHRAIDRNSRTKWPATPAPPSSPAPLPVRVAVSRSSALASSVSCRIRVERFSEMSEMISPTDDRGRPTYGSPWVIEDHIRRPAS